MKRTIKSLLAAAGLAFIGLGSLLTATAASASEQAITQGTPPVTCLRQDGGTYPENSKEFYCGDASLGAPHKAGYATSVRALPAGTQTQLNSQNTEIYVFCTEKEYERYFSTTPLYPDLRQLAAAYVPGPNRLYVFQYTIDSNSTMDCSSPTGTQAGQKTPIYSNAYGNMRHEIGHFLELKVNVPALQTRHSDLTKSNGTDSLYGKFTDADIYFFNNRLLRTPCTNSFFTNTTRDVFVNSSNQLVPVCTGGNTLNAELAGLSNFSILEKVAGYNFGTYGTNPQNMKELFAESFPIVFGLSGGQPSTSAANYYITNHFSCAKAYIKPVANNTNALPVTADYSQYNNTNDPNVEFRCNSYVAPPIPSGCSYYAKVGFNYPYRPGYEQYVYCGVNQATYANVAGDVLLNLPNSVGSSLLRDKFMQNNITLYVFESAAAAQAKLGATNIPNAALQAGVLGWSQPNPVAVAGVPLNKFIAVWEKWTPPAGGALTAVETSLAADGTPNRFRSGVSQQAGRMMDALVPNLSTSAAYQAALAKDKTSYNAKPTCNVFVAPVCSGGVVQAPYTGMTNYQILTTLYPFLSSNNNLLAEQVPVIAFSSAGTANGGTIKPMDDRLFHFHNCTKLYTDKQYNFWRAPNATELSAASCQ